MPSSIAARVTRAMIAAGVRPATTPGMIMCLSTSRLDFSPMNERIPPVGSQPRVTENRKMKTRPSQYAGMLSENTETSMIQSVGEGVLLDRGDDSRPDPDDDGEQARRPGEQHGDPELLHHEGKHRAALLDGLPPVALEDVPEPAEVLHVGGIVEAVLRAQRLPRFGRGEDAHQDVDGIPWRELDEGEDDGGRAEEHRDQEEEPPGEEAKHVAGSPA